MPVEILMVCAGVAFLSAGATVLFMQHLENRNRELDGIIIRSLEQQLHERDNELARVLARLTEIQQRAFYN